MVSIRTMFSGGGRYAPPLPPLFRKVSQMFLNLLSSHIIRTWSLLCETAPTSALFPERLWGFSLDSLAGASRLHNNEKLEMQMWHDHATPLLQIFKHTLWSSLKTSLKQVKIYTQIYVSLETGFEKLIFEFVLFNLNNCIEKLNLNWYLKLNLVWNWIPINVKLSVVLWHWIQLLWNLWSSLKIQLCIYFHIQFFQFNFISGHANGYRIISTKIWAVHSKSYFVTLAKFQIIQHNDFKNTYNMYKNNGLVLLARQHSYLITSAW